MASPEISTEKTDSLFTRTDSGEVVFHYFQPFDRETGEYDEHYGRFSQREYERGKMQLNTTGICKLQGYNCSLEISRIDGLFRVSFNTTNKGITLTSKTLEGFL